MNTSDPSAELLRLINGFQISQALHVAASLAVADHLKDGPKISCRSGTSLRCSSKIALSIAACAGRSWRFPRKRRHRVLAHPGRLLSDERCGGDPPELGAIYPGNWHAWGNLLHSVKSGEGAYPVTHGMNSWSYRQQHPEEQAVSDSAMTGNSLAHARAVLEAYDFKTFSRIVDIAGGQGLLLKEVLLACPASRGVLFDRPQGVESTTLMTTPGLENRVETFAGSFFDAIPPGGRAIAYG